MKTILKWISAIGVLALVFAVMTVPATAGAGEAEKTVPAAGQKAQYVGAETCKTCHEEIYKAGFERSPHFKTTLKDEHGCESCHGPGSLHVEGGGDVAQIVDFRKLTKGQANARCLSCHAEREEQAHFASSAHARSDVGCLDCHSPHHPKEGRRLLVASQPQLCYGCHTATKAEFAKPFRHRVNEGLVQCSDCHNLHGSESLHEARTVPGGDAICYKCHADKQGPFVFEHLPVKTEGCTSCHTPHSSTNARFLRVSQVNLLCLQCHTLPTQSPIGPTHNLSQKYQACTMCHPAIHGSNSNVALMK
jgi:DmsE family decaheme c-type cytochrome